MDNKSLSKQRQPGTNTTAKLEFQLICCDLLLKFKSLQQNGTRRRRKKKRPAEMLRRQAALAKNQSSMILSSTLSAIIEYNMDSTKSLDLSTQRCVNCQVDSNLFIYLWL
jgi:hypothetical protein